MGLVLINTLDPLYSIKNKYIIGKNMGNKDTNIKKLYIILIIITMIICNLYNNATYDILLAQEEKIEQEYKDDFNRLITSDDNEEQDRSLLEEELNIDNKSEKLIESSSKTSYMYMTTNKYEYDNLVKKINQSDKYMLAGKYIKGNNYYITFNIIENEET